jgi:hypothetical protein
VEEEKQLNCLLFMLFDIHACLKALFLRLRSSALFMSLRLRSSALFRTFWIGSVKSTTLLLSSRNFKSAAVQRVRDV